MRRANTVSMYSWNRAELKLNEIKKITFIYIQWYLKLESRGAAYS